MQEFVVLHVRQVSVLVLVLVCEGSVSDFTLSNGNKTVGRHLTSFAVEAEEAESFQQKRAAWGLRIRDWCC